MRRFNTLFVLSTFVIGISFVVFVSCKKNVQTFQNIEQYSDNSTKAKQVLEKINKFFDAREAYHGNSKIDNGKIPEEEICSILDMTVNYEFTDLSRYLEDVKLDTLSYNAPKPDAQGNVNLNDVIDIYDNFAEDISGKEYSVNYFMVVTNTDSCGDNIDIVFTSGKGETPYPPEPSLEPVFNEDDDWIWGGDNGKCEIGGYSDAAQELTKKFIVAEKNVIPDTINLKDLIWNVEYGNVNADSLNNIENCSTYWLFYAVVDNELQISTYCIEDDEMNCYWRSIRREVVMSTGRLHYSKLLNSPYRELLRIVDIEKDSVIYHSAIIKYYEIGSVN